jgi:hypothetical protein
MTLLSRFKTDLENVYELDTFRRVETLPRKCNTRRDTL